MKKIKIFLDSDVLLDILLKREPHFDHSQKLLALIENSRIEGHTSSLILANCYYIVENNKDKSTAEKAIRKLRSILIILPFTDKEIGESLSSNFKDFEDGVQYFITINNGIDTIITRNVDDYKLANIKVLSPIEFLKLKYVIEMIEMEGNSKTS